MQENYNEYKKLKDKYIFSLNIKNEKEYNDNLHKEVEVKHNFCKRKFTIKLKDFFKNKNNRMLDDIRIYLEDKTDEMCPFCMQEAKNKYFKDIMSKNLNNKFSLESNYINAKEEVEIKHLVCGETFKTKASNILYVKTEPICPHCSKLLTRAEKMRQWRMIQIKDRYDFGIDIKEKFLFKKYQDELVNIYHKTCKRHFKTTLKDFYRVNTGSLGYLFDYVESKLDLNCPYCMQEAKNKYFSDILKRNTNDEYELIGDYTISNAKVLVRHKVCKKEMEVWATNVISAKKPFKCPHCVKLLKNSERVKQNKFIQLKEEFLFPFKIEEPYLFKINLNKLVEIEHKACGRKFTVEFGKFNEINIGHLRYIEKYIKNKNDVKCPHCLQEAKNTYFQSILDEETNGDFVLIGNYVSIKEDVELLHKSCQKSFRIKAELISCKRRISCKLCEGEDNVYQNRLQEERNIKFKQELKEKGLEEFENIGKYINRTTETTFLHKKCGYEFNDTPEKFLRRTNKCPNCTGNNRVIFKSQEEKNQVFQKRLDKEASEFELRGDYIGRNEEVTLYHKNCKKEFTTLYSSFINAKYTCPYCQSNRYKYDRNLTIKEKIKYFEEELGSGYKILTGFVSIYDNVDIKHKKCGKIFSKKIYQAINRKKDSILCPYCEKEKRKNDFIKKLQHKFGDSYILVGEYVNGETETTFKHKGCDKIFKITPRKLLEKAIENCPYCKEKNLHRVEKFKQKLYKKHGANYVMVGEYVAYNEKVLFKHRKCETLFWETPYNILKKDIPCKKCSTKKRIIPIEEVKRRIKEKNGNLYTLTGEYMGTEKEMHVICNECNHVFEIAPFKLFRKKVCPQCKTKYKK